MDAEGLTPAPRWRKTVATAIDTLAVGGGWWLVRKRGWLRDRGFVLRLLAAPGDPLREQLRSPGERLLGLRTIDRRTGRRVALWRTLALTGVGAAGQELVRRVSRETSEQERAREELTAEMQAIMRRHPRASPAREAERRALFARHRQLTGSLARALVPTLALGLATTRLRRRLAPTRQVLVRRRRAHSP